jgi:hypothetical protein
MAFNDYHFVTVWQIPGDVEEVKRVIANGPDLARWWPSVYLDVQELEPGDEFGVGKVIDLYTKGWLPYTLRWRFRISEVRQDGFTLEAYGDFVGRGIWTFAQDGPNVVITYDWKIRADKPLLRYLSPILKPIFKANHRWAMAKGEESLKLELARRRATTTEQRNRIPPPPPPTTTSSLPLLAGLIVMLIAVGLVIRRRFPALLT